LQEGQTNDLQEGQTNDLQEGQTNDLPLETLKFCLYSSVRCIFLKMQLSCVKQFTMTRICYFM
jgi:hypothetical protein